jgi:hypothetical protein
LGRFDGLTPPSSDNARRTNVVHQLKFRGRAVPPRLQDHPFMVAHAALEFMRYCRIAAIARLLMSRTTHEVRFSVTLSMAFWNNVFLMDWGRRPAAIMAFTEAPTTTRRPRGLRRPLPRRRQLWLPQKLPQPRGLRRQWRLLPHTGLTQISREFCLMWTPILCNIVLIPPAGCFGKCAAHARSDAYHRVILVPYADIVAASTDRGSHHIGRAHDYASSGDHIHDGAN